jgi:hypothetical protein
MSREARSLGRVLFLEFDLLLRGFPLKCYLKQLLDLTRLDRGEDDLYFLYRADLIVSVRPL